MNIKHLIAGALLGASFLASHIDSAVAAEKQPVMLQNMFPPGPYKISDAAADGDLKGLARFLAEDPTAISAKGGQRSLLAIAARNGQTEAVKFLIAAGADVNQAGPLGLTPLAEMASLCTNDQRCAEIAAILLPRGALVDSVDAYKNTPLLYATQNRKSQLARTLLQYGANPSVSFSGSYSRTTPLCWALKHGDKEMTAVLLEFKPPLEAKDSEGATPLMWAVKSKKHSEARLLLEHGASPTPAFTITRSGTFMTTRSGTTEIIYRSDAGKSPLHWAVFNWDREMVALLLEFNAPVDAKDDSGLTPLHIAELSKNKEIEDLIRQRVPAATPSLQAQAPSEETMRAIAKRIAEGDAAAFDELAAAAAEMYRGMNDKDDNRARMTLNYNRLHLVFNFLGEEAGKGNDHAFQALKNCLRDDHLNGFAPDALGIAAAAGHAEALDILLNFKKWKILESSAGLALVEPAKANIQPAVDYFAALIVDPASGNRGVIGAARDGLQGAAAKGNQTAKDALAKYEAEDAKQMEAWARSHP